MVLPVGDSPGRRGAQSVRVRRSEPRGGGEGLAQGRRQRRRRGSVSTVSRTVASPNATLRVPVARSSVVDAPKQTASSTPCSPKPRNLCLYILRIIVSWSLVGLLSSRSIALATGRGRTIVVSRCSGRSQSQELSHNDDLRSLLCDERITPCLLSDVDNTGNETKTYMMSAAG